VTTGERTALLTALTMLAFAANSLFCRLALSRTGIDAATFTCVRLLSGALVLGVLVRLRRGGVRFERGSFRAALLLFLYAAAFSFAYVQLPTGIGALLLFGAVQLSMIGVGIGRGERLGRDGWLGLILAVLGLVVVALPGSSAPDPAGASLMVVAGIAWGGYSLLGRGTRDSVGATAGNFIRAAPMGVALAWALGDGAPWPFAGVVLATASGALASAGGYVLWSAVLPRLRATDAAIVQLSVPALAAALGIVVLGERPTLRLLAGGIGILCGIGLAVRSPFGRTRRA
jgi:drug/metabolite transporter (DMT)-like permease